MNCKDVLCRLPDFIRSEITEGESKSISNHLMTCKQCSNELETLKIFFIQIEKEKAWQPSDLYWNTLLPRINNRIQSTSKWNPYTRIMQIALPAAAAIVLVVLSLQLLPAVNGNNSQDIQADIKQLPNEELHDYLQQQSIVGAEESYDYADNIVSSDADKIVVKELLQEGNSLTAYLNADQEILYDAINDQTAEEVVSILENKSVHL